MSSGTSLFFPQGMSPDRYIQMFIDEFKKLGFTDDDITLSIVDYTNSVWYNIKLKW